MREVEVMDAGRWAMESRIKLRCDGEMGGVVERGKDRKRKN